MSNKNYILLIRFGSMRFCYKYWNDDCSFNSRSSLFPSFKKRGQYILLVIEFKALKISEFKDITLISFYIIFLY